MKPERSTPGLTSSFCSPPQSRARCAASTGVSAPRGSHVTAACTRPLDTGVRQVGHTPAVGAGLHHMRLNDADIPFYESYWAALVSSQV